jgi:hypothetical protein
VTGRARSAGRDLAVAALRWAVTGQPRPPAVIAALPPRDQIAIARAVRELRHHAAALDTRWAAARAAAAPDGTSATTATTEEGQAA